MDRKIPKEVLRKEKRNKFIKTGTVVVASIIAIILIISLLRDSISLKNIQLSTVDNGTIEVSVSASGKVVPAFEEIINTPIESRIMEMMCLKRNIKLTFIADDALPLLQLDGSLFEQVLLNIIKNSVESIENDGKITITTNAQNQSLEIADNGKGISKEIESKLFNPFFSSKPMGQGLGLLFIREVLTQHNCRYSLRTYDDGLTRFVMQFER